MNALDSQAAHPWPTDPTDRREAIRRRAEEIYIRSGRIPGHDLENWMRAEQEILREAAETTARRKAIVVRVQGVEYVGEYDPASSDGYTPGELKKGVAVAVRFSGDKMFVKRPDGRELETTVVRRTG